MKATYATLATLMASLGNIHGNPEFPGFGPGQAKQLLDELAPGIACLAYGSVAGTGSAIKVGSDADDGGDDVVNADFLKFDPLFVLVLNKTDGTIFFHIAGMAAASYITGAAYVGANGITLRTNGFTLGTAAALNTAEDELFYLAIGR